MHSHSHSHFDKHARKRNDDEDDDKEEEYKDERKPPPKKKTRVGEDLHCEQPFRHQDTVSAPIADAVVDGDYNRNNNTTNQNRSHGHGRDVCQNDEPVDRGNGGNNVRSLVDFGLFDDNDHNDVVNDNDHDDENEDRQQQQQQQQQQLLLKRNSMQQQQSKQQQQQQCTKENETKVVTHHRRQIKLHHPLPVHDDDNGENIEMKNQISTSVAIEATIVGEAAIQPSHSQSQLQQVANQQQQQQHQHQQQQQLFQSSTTSKSTTTTTTTSGDKSDANTNKTSTNVSSSSSPKERKEYIRWMDMYQRLLECKKEHNASTTVPINYKKDPQLGRWVSTQRNFNNNNTLLHDRHSLLDSIDFDWGNGPKGPNTYWMKTYQRLLAYKKEHDDSTMVPTNYKKDPQLGRWVRTQRTLNNDNKLLPARRTLLDSINFDLGTGPQGLKTDWMESYQRLVAYKEEHNGSTKVPHNYEKNPQLGRWVATQRNLNNSNTLLPDRHSLLDSIDFDWGDGKRIYTDWMDSYQQLVVYKQQYNTTNVPTKYKEDRLGVWVSNQRAAYNNKSIKEERCQLLNSINFDWGNGPKGSNVDWMKMYQRLVVYKQQHGNTNVPARYKEDPQLGNWVPRQRSNYKNKIMKEERASLLNSIGFDWKESKRRRRIKTSKRTDEVSPPTSKGVSTHAAMMMSSAIAPPPPPPLAATPVAVQVQSRINIKSSSLPNTITTTTTTTQTTAPLLPLPLPSTPTKRSDSVSKSTSVSTSFVPYRTYAYQQVPVPVPATEQTPQQGTTTAGTTRAITSSVVLPTTTARMNIATMYRNPTTQQRLTLWKQQQQLIQHQQQEMQRLAQQQQQHQHAQLLVQQQQQTQPQPGRHFLFAQQQQRQRQQQGIHHMDDDDSHILHPHRCPLTKPPRLPITIEIKQQQH